MTRGDAAALLAVLREAAAEAATEIRAAAPRVRTIAWQPKVSPADFVSEVDVTAEGRIREVIARHLPEAAFLGEETASAIDPATLARGVTIVADPLDGTTNFLHGFPEYAVSIAAVVDGTLAAGVVLHVPRDEWTTATAGGGTFRGDERLTVSPITDPRRALIGTGFPFKSVEDIPPYQAQMARVMAGAAGVRRPGAASLDLASVAGGRFDAFWEMILAPWDVAAGILLVREAGGVCTDLDGAPATVAHSGIVAGSPAIHAWLLATLHDG